MASPKELVVAVAKETGVSESTVVQHDRNLALAELRTVGGRGRAVATVSFQDAANLLIAVAASRNVKDSAKTVRDYAPLIASAPLVFNDEGREVVRGQTFGDALAAMLEAVPAEAAAYDDPELGHVEVFLYGPAPSARLRWRVGKRAEDISYEPPARGKGEKAVRAADLQFISKFTQITLGFVGQLVAGR